MARKSFASNVKSKLQIKLKIIDTLYIIVVVIPETVGWVEEEIREN